MTPKPTHNLTKRQKQILDFIRGFEREHGIPPSYREIGKGMGLSSPATVFEHIQALQQKGMLKRGYNEIRSLELSTTLSHLDGGVMELPLIGLITAGEPIEAIEERETMAVPGSLVVDGLNSYVLRVKGQSMIEDGILDGDFVIIERNPSPKNGDVVVALLDNAYATLKKFYREKDKIRLQPANSTMSPIFVKDLIVQGVVRAVIRQFRTA